MEENLILSMDHIGKFYHQTPVLKGVSMKIPKGAIYGLVGSNGAGKSTIMRIISGQTKADEGTLFLFGTEPTGKNQKLRHRIGTLIEEPGFYNNMTAFQNLEYFRILFGVPGKERVKEVLDLVGLSDTGRKKYKNFSMGMKQRLGLALAMLHSPEFLILDEPINGLDPEGILEIRTLLLELNRKYKVTILISSHILAELENLATEYGFLSQGSLVEEITAAELQKKCGTYIDLEVLETEKMCTLLERELGIFDYQVYPDGHIHIFQNLNEQEQISRLAVLNQISLKTIRLKTLELEEYYMNLMGGETNAGIYEE
jgi:ABC-2 type transport system ATP-binding protein